MTTTFTYRERPIIFSAPMVRAILDGRKTVTRRIVKPDTKAPVKEAYEEFEPGTWGSCATDGTSSIVTCPFGLPGDRLWVRETFCDSRRNRNGGREVLYRADTSFLSIGENWRPPIFMPRWASRLTLEVVSVQVERLQEISVEDAKAEGVEEHDDDGVTYYGPFGKGHVCAVSAFAILWEEINGPGSWSANPWVWRIEFRRLP